MSEPGGGLLLCDVDHFKDINDRHGHRTGDLVLSEIARILTRHGYAGRLGGDEFAVWVPGGRRQASAAAAAILRDIDHELAAPGASTGVGVSIGIALAPDNGTTIDALLAAADIALYRAKDGGRRQAQITSGLGQAWARANGRSGPLRVGPRARRPPNWAAGRIGAGLNAKSAGGARVGVVAYGGAPWRRGFCLMSRWRGTAASPGSCRRAIWSGSSGSTSRRGR